MKDWQFFILLGIGFSIMSDLDHLRGRMILAVVSNILSVIFLAIAVVCMVTE